MENVILIILLILALALIGIVLMQRSEGGGLGIGGGGGGGAMTGRSAATALGRLTWYIGGAFMAFSLLMTVLAARNTADTSVIDQLGTEIEAPADAEVPAADDLLPPSGDSEDLLPPRAD